MSVWRTLTRWRVLFSGIVRHRRFSPTLHEFEYPIRMFLLKTDELPKLLDRHWQLGTEWYRWARFKRADYLGEQKI